MLQPDGSYLLAQQLLLRGLGLVYLVAFASLGVQVRGLYGRQGLLPMVELRERLRRRGRKLWFQWPSLFWLGCSDRILTGAAILGVLLALALIAGLPAVPCLLGLYLLYLSFVNFGRDFLGFQWDMLLLEAGVMATAFALATPPTLLTMAVWWLFLFRFLFSSGVVKLRSGDRTWRDLTALCHHYQTQPLPVRLAWHLHQSPCRWLRLHTAATFVCELAVPFLVFGPASVRLWACGLSIGFQVVLIATGNFAFLNLLTIVLCLSLVPGTAGAIPSSGLAILVNVLFLGFGLLQLLQLLRLFYRWPLGERLLARLAPWQISNGYGLFAVMTTDRFEWEVEGSDDGSSWHPYAFRWKPGDLRQPPCRVAPHQPRLDWQMWFAALAPYQIPPWLSRLQQQLLEGAPPVLRLLRHTPFPDAPPKAVRLRLYRYRFTDAATRRETGAWWQREELGATEPLMAPP